MELHCDGGPDSGVARGGGRCRCGRVFNNADRQVIFPHEELPKPYSILSGSAIASGIAVTMPAWTGTAVYPTTGPRSPVYSFAPPPPSSDTFTRLEMKQFAQSVATLARDGQRVVICVNEDVTDAQMAEIQTCLEQQDVDGILIRAARAGYGMFPADGTDSARERHVDLLARIADLWERRPALRLAELLGWYAGARMDDEDFLACTEVHFEKIIEGE